MKYLAEFRAYPIGVGQSLHTFNEEFIVSDELGIDQANGIVLEHMKEAALRYALKNPNERCTLQNIYRCAGDSWQLTYEKH